jgi:hypothetical protein
MIDAVITSISTDCGFFQAGRTVMRSNTYPEFYDSIPGIDSFLASIGQDSWIAR